MEDKTEVSPPIRDHPKQRVQPQYSIPETIGTNKKTISWFVALAIAGYVYSYIRKFESDIKAIIQDQTKLIEYRLGEKDRIDVDHENRLRDLENYTRKK